MIPRNLVLVFGVARIMAFISDDCNDFPTICLNAEGLVMWNSSLEMISTGNMFPRGSSWTVVGADS